MIKKLYLCEKDGLRYLSLTTKQPPYFIMEAPPEAQEVTDLDVIESEGDEAQGIAPHKYAVVNETRKSQRLDAEGANRAAKDLLLEEKKQAGVTRKGKMETLTTKLKNSKAEGDLKDAIDLVILMLEQK